MQDDRGLYYYPFPENKQIRMYVIKMADDICFRMWNPDQPELWDEHGWVPYDAIKQAQAIYTGKGIDPKQAYDLEVAKEIIREKKQS